MFQTFISRHNSNFFSDKLVLTSVTPASSAPVLQTPKATSSTLYFDSLTVNAGNGGFLHCIQMDTSVNAANQVVSVGADIAFDADPKFFACLVRFESSSVPTTLPTAYDVYPLDGRHDGGYYTVKDCVTIDVLPRTPGNNVYVGFMVWSNFTATKCRGLVSLNQVIKEIICLQPRSEERFSRNAETDLVCRLSCSSLFPYTTLFRSDVYPLDGRHDGGYYTVKDCVTIDVLPRTPGNNVYVGFMVWSNFTATKCRGLVSLNQVIKEIICLQPLK